MTEKERLANLYGETMKEIDAWVEANADAAHRAAFQRWKHAPFTMNPDGLNAWREMFELNGLDPLVAWADLTAPGTVQDGDAQLLKELGAQIPSELKTASLLYVAQAEPGTREWLKVLF